MSKLIIKSTVRANPYILNGIGATDMQRPERCLKEIFQAGAETFPPEVTFDDITICTPSQAAEFVTRTRSNKSSASACRSDLILVKVQFSLRGVPQQTKYMHLPVVGEGGRFILGGGDKVIKAVISDLIITGDPAKGSIFIKLLKDKIRLHRTAYAIRKNNKIIAVNILHGKIHKTRSFVARKKSILTTIVHYILIDLGIDKALENIGVTSWMMLTAQEGVFPVKKGFTLFSSNLKEELMIYVATDQVTPLAEKYIASIIYICDNSELGNKDTIRSELSLKVMLGEIIYKEKKGNFSYLSDAMDAHIESIASQMDMMTKKILHQQAKSEKGALLPFKEVDNFMELLVLIVQNSDDIISYSAIKPNNITLDVKYSFYYDMIKRVNLLAYTLKTKKEKKGEEGISEGDLRTVLNQQVLTDRVFSISRDSKAVDNFRTSTDNYYLAGGINAASNVDVSGPYDQALVFSAHEMEAGTISSPSKTQLIPGGKINCFYYKDRENLETNRLIEYTQSRIEEQIEY